MHRSLTAVALLAMLLGTSCGESTAPVSEQASATEPAISLPPPTPAEAAELIAKSQPFGDHEFTYASWTFRTDTPLTHETTLAMARDLEKEGWIRINEGRVELTDKSRADKRFLLRPNGTLDIVPLAKKELIEVTSVTPAENGATATIRWRWIPNEVGSSFTSGPVKARFDAEQTAEVDLRPSVDGTWEVWGVS